MDIDDIVQTFEKSLHANRVELGAGMLVQIILGVLGFPGAFVGPGRYQCVIDVGNRDDACY
jgi:hypothetical protein